MTKHHGYHCCKSEGAFRIRDSRFNLDWTVGSYGGLPQALFNNTAKEYLTSYPVPVALQVKSGNVGYGTKLLMSAVASKDGETDNVTGDHDLLDEISSFVIGDSQGIFECGVIPVYGASASDADDATTHTVMRINDEELGIDVKVETSSFLQATAGATNEIVTVEKVYDLNKRKKCTENEYKCLSFVTYEIHAVNDTGNPAAEIFITFVKNKRGKYFMGLLHGAAALVANVPAGGIYPKPKSSASYKPVAWQKFKIISVPIKSGVGIDTTDLRGKILSKSFFDLEVMQRSLSADATANLTDGAGFILGVYSGAVTVATDTVDGSQSAAAVSVANQISSYNAAGTRLIAAFTGFLADFNALLASLV